MWYEYELCCQSSYHNSYECVPTRRSAKAEQDTKHGLRCSSQTKAATIALVSFSWPPCMDLLGPVLTCLVLIYQSSKLKGVFFRIARAVCVRFKTRFKIALPTFVGNDNICRTIDLSFRGLGFRPCSCPLSC